MHIGNIITAAASECSVVPQENEAGPSALPNLPQGLPAGVDLQPSDVSPDPGQQPVGGRLLVMSTLCIPMSVCLSFCVLQPSQEGCFLFLQSKGHFSSLNDAGRIGGVQPEHLPDSGLQHLSGLLLPSLHHLSSPKVSSSQTTNLYLNLTQAFT